MRSGELSSGETFLSVPDFVVVGGRVDGDVILLASKKLSYMELKEVLRDQDYLRYMDAKRLFPQEYDMYLTTKIKDYVMIRAKTYPEAWAGLFDMWSPEPERRKEIDGQKQLKNKYDWPEPR